MQNCQIRNITDYKIARDDPRIVDGFERSKLVIQLYPHIFAPNQTFTINVLTYTFILLFEDKLVTYIF